MRLSQVPAVTSPDGCAAPPLPNQIVVSWDGQSSKLRGVLIEPGHPLSYQPIITSRQGRPLRIRRQQHTVRDGRSERCCGSTCMIVHLI
ncbi:hypothetical protein M3J09_007257 [Ascochyta lentis]